ncbi:MAG TPA: TA system VapC family ribonuclease toxin [Bryobacterales bacterium]|nr:TA system VapC family ribonuclease toxin [Bryobacterales bacterium]
MKSSLFPDVNVWLALTHARHAHHLRAAKWFESLTGETLFFCRFTQIGLLRLLTSEVVMGTDVMGRRAAWQACRRWLDDERIEFHREPESGEFDRRFQDLSTRPHASPKLWADVYLAAFARTAGLTIVTFDRALGQMASSAATVLSVNPGQ